MNYKYPPIYKYILLLILFTTFLKYYKVITKKNYLLVVSIFVYMVFIFDYMLVDKHPNLFDDKIDINTDNKEEKKTTKIFVKKNNNIKQKKCKKIKVIDDKIIKVTKSNISNEDKEMYDLDKELEDYNQSLNNNADINENLTDEIQRELDELNL